MRKDVDWYVRNCHDCQRFRRSRHASSGVHRPLSVPEKSWEDISMDFVVGLLECEGFHAIVTGVTTPIQDTSLKYFKVGTAVDPNLYYLRNQNYLQNHFLLKI